MTNITEFARLEAERRIAQAWADASEHIEPSDFDASEIESLSVRVDVELPGALWCQCCRDALPTELVRGLRLDGRDDTYTSTATIITIDGVEHVRLCRGCAAEFVSELGGALDGRAGGVVPAHVHERGWQWRPTDADTAFAPPFGTIRQCRVCGCLVAGGPTACARCAEVSL